MHILRAIYTFRQTFCWTALLLCGVGLSRVAAAQTAELAAELVVSASTPLFVSHAPGYDEYLFVMERAGRIRALDLHTNEFAAEPLLDLTGQIYTGGEAGLLGMAFHPDFETNGRFFIYVSDDHVGNGQHTSYIRSYEVADPVSSESPRAVLSSEVEVLSFEQPQRNHNAGWIGFGPDDQYLYIASGDGGSGNDAGPGHTPEIGNAQDITDNLLGKMLRIDVDADQFPLSDSRNYAIPADNPFVDTVGDDEIWSYGLRNPWRSSFDRVTGDLWIGDVGQAKREEINFQPADSAGGENYGWKIREGSVDRITGQVGGGKPEGNVDPVHDYGRSGAPDGGTTVIGGYVYRGPIATLQGHYIFADRGSSQIWSFTYDGQDVDDFTNRTLEFAPDVGSLNNVVSFGEDAIGNLYLLTGAGRIYRLQGAGAPGDYNLNTVVDLADYVVWRDSFGERGEALPADGNGDHEINAPDYAIWRDLRFTEERLPGDYSLNGVVDAADYNLWRDSFLSEGADLMADGNGNGRVDTPDYVVWRDARQAATQTVSVPEPWGAALMIAALAVALGWGRSGHRG